MVSVEPRFFDFLFCLEIGLVMGHGLNLDFLDLHDCHDLGGYRPRILCEYDVGSRINECQAAECRIIEYLMFDYSWL